MDIKGNFNALVTVMMDLCYRCVQKSSLAVGANCAWRCMNARDAFSEDLVPVHE